MSAQRPSRHSIPSRVGDTLQRILQRIDPDHRMDAYRVWTFWDSEVGESLARHAQPDSFHAGVLSIRVDGATWMQELQFLKEGIRGRLNERLGAPLIRDIYFVSGRINDRAVNAKPPGPPRARHRVTPPVPMPRLHSPELADVFERIAAASAKRRRDE